MPRRSPRPRLLLGVLLAAVMWGCGHGPRYRLGSLPFPGPFTLFAAADGELGTHHYGDQPRAGAPREVSRGTLYTCRAGFIDVAHLRETIDWTRNIHEQVLGAFSTGSTLLRFDGPDDTDYELTFHYPAQWAAATPDERHLAALRIAQRTSLLIMTWHEVLTGSGYKTTGVVSERRSAFTYDDMSAHLVGVQVAAQALADPRPYDQAVTIALDARLADLGVVDHDCLRDALHAVEGTWWHGIHARRLQHDTGRFEGRLEPFVISGLACCPDAVAEPLEWPAADLPTLDAEALASIVLELETRVGQRIAGGERIVEDDVYRWVEAFPDIDP